MVADGLAAIQERAEAAGDLAVDGAGDDVLGRQFGAGVIGGHERRAEAASTRIGALAAQGLAGQGRGVEAEVDGGGVELHELRIGDPRPGQGRQPQPLAAHGGRVGGHGVEAAEPAGGQHRRRSDHLDQPPAALDQGAAHGRRSRPAAGRGRGRGPRPRHGRRRAPRRRWSP